MHLVEPVEHLGELVHLKSVYDACYDDKNEGEWMSAVGPSLDNEHARSGSGENKRTLIHTA